MIREWLRRYTESKDIRGKRIVQQIAAGAGLKVINAAVGIVIIPLYLSLLTETNFGIWLTVSAVINWFNIFDLGLGNGLRNRFAEAKAAGNDLKARIYVSTAYFCISGIALILALLFLIADMFVDWTPVFAAPTHLASEVNAMTRILALLFLPQFVAQLIKMVATADQRPAIANLINSTVNIAQLIAVYMLIQLGDDRLSTMAITMGGINLAIPILANVWLFAGRYRPYVPTFRLVQMRYARDLLGLGAMFFILQGAALIVFMTDNLIISQVLGPGEVPAYNIAYRYFNFAAVFFALLTTPFWSAFTEAFAKRDMSWISSMLNRLFKVWAALSAVCLLMLIAAPWIYPIWVGPDLHIGTTLNLVMAFWVILSTGLSILGTLLSGLGKLRITLYHAVFVMIVNIPLSIWLAGFPALGAAGVMLASILGASVRLLFQPLQCYRLIKGTASGIWNR